MASSASIVVKYAADVRELVNATGQIERSASQAGQATKKVDWKNIAGLAASSVALGAGAVYIKKAADATNTLAKETATLQRATGLDAETASAWISTLKGRGIEVSAFQTSLVRLSKLMETYRLRQIAAAEATKFYADAEKELRPIIDAGGDAGKEATKSLNSIGAATDKAVAAAQKAADPFERLGVNLKDVRKGNVGAVLLQTADGFKEIENPATKAATAAALFGRQGQRLVPILQGGSAAIEEQLDLAKEYGAVVGQKQVNQVKKNAAAQRELALAQKGVQIQLGSFLLPAQVLLWEILLKVTQALAPLTDNMYVMIPAVTLAGIGWLAYTAATVAATVASIGLSAAVLLTVGIVAAVVVGLVVLAAALVLAYKKVDVFREIVDETFTWIKRNWPLLLAILLGPIATATYLIIRNWDRISDGARSAVATIKTIFGTVKAAVLAALAFGEAAWNVINNIGETINRYVRTIQGWGSSVGDWIKDAAVNAIVGIGSAIWTKLGEAWAYLRTFLDTIKGWGTTLGSTFRAGFVSAISGIGDVVVAAFRGAINAIIRIWNAIKIPGFSINPPGPGPKIKFPAINFPNIATLARGGIVTGPTLAMVGERGPEAVIPLGAGGNAPLEVRVFIGDRELTGIVRTEVRTANDRTAQTLLAGAV